MTPLINQRIVHPSAWKASEFKSKDDYAIDLESHHLAALERAMERVKDQGLQLAQINKQSFPLDGIEDLIEQVRHELLEGRGFLLLRGWPVREYSLEDIAMMYFGFGSHFGKAASQSVMGDRLGYVRDFSHEDENERAYRNKYALDLHTDLNDLIGMLNIHQSPRGGESQYASAIAIHNEIFATRPDLLPPLYEGFHYHRRGEEGPGEGPVTPHKVPIFSTVDNVLSCRYVDSYMPAAAKELGIEMSCELQEAITCFERIAASEEFSLDLKVEPGEMTFSNNLVTLHGRRAFADDATDPTKKRLFLRLWLDVDAEHARPQVPQLRVYENDSIAKREGRTPVYSGESWRELIEGRTHLPVDPQGTQAQ